ncbi:MAG: polyphosphate kinase 1 [Deinococcota bacterium]
MTNLPSTNSAQQAASEDAASTTENKMNASETDRQAAQASTSGETSSISARATTTNSASTPQQLESSSSASNEIQSSPQQANSVSSDPSLPMNPLLMNHALPKATAPRPVPAGADLNEPTLYFNRELGDIDFNWRVLYQAVDPRTPLLERVRFLSIAASNLDEFFQKRVGGLLRQQGAGVTSSAPDGRTPAEQLALIRSTTRDLYSTIDQIWATNLRPALAEVGVIVTDYDDLSVQQQDELKRYFHKHIYPILTPLAVDPGRPFPFISNLSLSLAITLVKDTQGVDADETSTRIAINHDSPDATTNDAYEDAGYNEAGYYDELDYEAVTPTRPSFVRLKIPVSRGRWVEVVAENGQSNQLQLVPLEQVIAHNVSELFPGMTVQGVHPFRVTRNADVRRDEEEAEDLLAVISEELRERRFASVVRLEVNHNMPVDVRDYLASHLKISHEDIFEGGMLELSDCGDLANTPLIGAGAEHLYSDWQPVTPRRFNQRTNTGDKRSIFDIIREGDVLVHHPYETFGATVQRLLEEASNDPNVLAIKQTLYRTSNDSPIVGALIRAAEQGKQVAALVEVKARFDEANNIEWGERLEDSGVHVAYGLVGLKIHAKVMLIVRQEPDGIRTYCHIGTGNYNSKTARLYTDLGLFTCRPDIGEDLVNLFHHITGYAPRQRYKSLVIAPRHMRARVISLIEREIAIQQDKGCGRIIAKMNGLDDLPIIHSLYRASQAGVSIDLIIRGHCRLRPGLTGYSENIRVRSIIGRFLEHDRIFYFGNDSSAFEHLAEPSTIQPERTPDIFIGSADWKRRNLSDRIEAVVSIEAPDLQRRLMGILRLALNDNRLAWQLDAQGNYVQQRPAKQAQDTAKDTRERALHNILMARATRQHSR